MITSLSELYFRFRWFIVLLKTKKMLSKKQRWVRFDLILTMRDTHTISNLNTLIKLTSSSGSTVQKYPPMEHLLNDHKDHPNQHKNSHKLWVELGHPVFSLLKSHGSWDNNMIRVSQCRESCCKTNTSVNQ